MYISTFKTSGKLNLSVIFPIFDKGQKGEKRKHYPSKIDGVFPSCYEKKNHQIEGCSFTVNRLYSQL